MVSGDDSWKVAKWKMAMLWVTRSGVSVAHIYKVVFSTEEERLHIPTLIRQLQHRAIPLSIEPSITILSIAWRPLEIKTEKT